MKPTARRTGTWLLVGALVVFLTWAFWPEPLKVDLAEVTEGALMVTVDEEGETRVKERFVVSAPVAGKVLRIELEPGDPVTPDSILAAFQPVEPGLLDARSRAEAEAQERAAVAALGRARADLERANAELRFSRADVARYEKLAIESIVSAEQLESSRLELSIREEAVSAGKYAVAAARHDLERARARLVDQTASGDRAAINLRSPIEGVVLRRLHESEAVVMAGQALLEVGDPEDLEIVTDLLSTDAVRIGVGNRVLIEDWGGEDTLEGRVRVVEPYGFTKISALGVEEQRVNVIVDLVDSRERWLSLGDGYRVEVRVVYWEGDLLTKVPTNSLFRNGDSWAVFVASDGRAELREIELGHRDSHGSHEAEVIRGLEPGEQVIVHPSDAVVDGVKIEERES